MNYKELYYTIIDVDKIQNFIFESSKLTHITGGSILISYLTSLGFCINNNILDLESKSNSIMTLSDRKYWFEIYFGGGNLKLIFNSQKNAENFVKKYQLLFSKELETVTFTSIIYKVTTNNYKIFNRDIENAEIELKKLKSGKEISLNNYANPVFKICSFCKKRNSETTFEIYNAKKNKKEFCCKDCKKRQDAFTNDDNVFKNTNIINLQNIINKPFFQNFEEIQEIGNSYIGIVTVDGNKFGEKINRFLSKTVNKGSEPEKIDIYLKALNEFSENINKGVTETLLEVLNEDGFSELLKGKKNILFRPIIMGGDDLCFVIDGKKAIPFTEALLKRLELKFIDQQLTFASGISIVKTSFPFSIAHQLSESLQSNSKKETRDRSALDFEIINTSSIENLSDLRAGKYYYTNNGIEYKTTMRPFIVDNEKNIYKKNELDWRSFSTLISVLKGIQGRELLARNKIKELRVIPRQGEKLSEYEFNRLISRMSRDNIKKIWDRLKRIYKENTIWIKYEEKFYNNFVDIAELNEFYSDKIHNKEEGK